VGRCPEDLQVVEQRQQAEEQQAEEQAGAVQQAVQQQAVQQHRWGDASRAC